MTQTNAPRDYAALGLQFVTETVRKTFGPNKSDVRVVTDKAQIGVIVDLDLFRKAFGDEFILECADGTSLRVQSQAVNRSEAALAALKKGDVEAVREMIYDRIKGTRRTSRTTTVEVKVYTLPGGDTYKGADLVEYQSLYAAALVDLGTPADVARSVALTITL